MDIGIHPKVRSIMGKNKPFAKPAIAGNLSFGEELRNKIEPFLFGTPANEVRAGRFRHEAENEEFLQEKGRHWGEIKLDKAPSGISNLSFNPYSWSTHLFVRVPLWKLFPSCANRVY